MDFKKAFAAILLLLIQANSIANETPKSWQDKVTFLGKPDAVASICVGDTNLTTQKSNEFFEVKNRINNLVNSISDYFDDEILFILMIGESRDLQENQLFKQNTLEPYGGCTDDLLNDLNRIVNDIEENAVKSLVNSPEANL